ncbi:hypothetical protein KY348_00755, partial [Candidatus Woesearchaeota archaeon]|nr:hypothetical protein [Candidatus Woesearchaeota archaeon]
MGGIKVIANKEEFEITKENLESSVKRLQTHLKKGTPVMVESWSYSSLIFGGGHKTKRHLFFSNGRKIEDDTFSVKKGKFSGAYADCRGKDNMFESYTLTSIGGDNSINVSNKIKSAIITLPHNWTMPQYNEGTFSPAGGISWTSRHGAGTSKIMLGDKVRELFPKALNAVRFVQDGATFDLDVWYSMPGYLVTSKEIPKEEEGNRIFESKLSRFASLQAAFRLIKQAGWELKTCSSSLHVRQIGFFQDGVEYYRDELGYPVDEDDYVVDDMMHPH